MEIKKTHIVVSLAGRDKDRPFIVVETENDFVYLVDGKLRKLEAPKKKRRKHVAFAGQLGERLSGKLLREDKVLNSEIRRALAEFTAEAGGDDAASSRRR